jgi:protein phosphatase
MDNLCQVGTEVCVRGTLCTVRFVGSTYFAEGEWVGVEFPIACGRNDGSVEGERYFDCEPRHGLFVRPAQVQPASEANERVERDTPELHVGAWAAMEQVLEAESLEAGAQGDRVLEHLENLYPEVAAESSSPAPGGRGGGSNARSQSSGSRGVGVPAGSLGGRIKKRASRAGTESGVAGSPAHKSVGGIDDAQSDAELAARLRERYATLPQGYTGPSFAAGGGGGAPSQASMVELLQYIKATVAASGESGGGGSGVERLAGAAPAVPGKLAIELLLGAKDYIEAHASSVVELPLSEGRVVLVGDTHGQLNDFCWILKAHGPPGPGNVYLINGDVADRGAYAVEIYLLLFGFMMACPGCVYLNRGNHESFDMNIRGFHEGGGFASEVSAKYDSEVFTLFQSIFNLLPLATRINNEVLVVHGGLSRSGNSTLEQLRSVQRVRPVPVSTADARDLLFFDTMWSDPQEAPGISRSLARGSVCVTFGPDITRRFCELNRLRMIIRSHEVPRSMSGVAVQHDGRMITVFSASNYCGRIGNTGGTMLLTPSLDYQLMEHWSPSIAELLRIEEEEEAAARGGEMPPDPPPPPAMRRQFSSSAELMMQADVLEKLKDMLCAHTPALRDYYEHADSGGNGAIDVTTWAQGLREVVKGGAALPWEEYANHLATVDAGGRISYRAFLNRYRVTPGKAGGWQARLLSSMYEALSGGNLQQTVAFFDTNQDGVVTYDELYRVMSKFAVGLPDASVAALTRQLLRGQSSLRTAELLDMLDVTFREEGKQGLPPRSPPPWAAPLLEAVSKQCAMRQADSIESFKGFDADGDGFISIDEFQQAMLRLSGQDGAASTPEQHERITTMLRDLANWVDRDGDGKIDYLEFISAFRVRDASSAGTPPSAYDSATPSAYDSGDNETAIDLLLEHLCTLFYRHRWSLKHAFEYFDANSDGVLTPDEFSTALKALSTLRVEDDEMDLGASSLTAGMEALRLTSEQTDTLVASLDRNADGVIDYEEFLHALQARDLMQR